MDMQNVSNLQILEGTVRTIHDKDNRLIWGRLAYDTKYAGDTVQDGTPTPDAPIPVQVVTGEQTVTIGDGTSLQSYAIDLTGKNLWNPNNVLVGYELNSSGVTNANAQRNTLDYTEASAETTYAISGAIFKRVCFYNSSKTFISTLVINSDTFTTPVNTKYFRIAIDNTTSFSEAQIEEGSSATTYAPYYNYELCKIGDYQDYIYKSGDDWYVHKVCGKVVLVGNSDEDWALSGTGTPNFYYRYRYLPYATASVGLSNYFTRINITGSNTDVGFSLINSNQVRFRPNFAELSVNDWKTWLSTHNTIVYYTLATATDTQITDSTLVGQLNAVHEWLTRYGYNATVNGNLPIIIDRTNL